MIATGNGLVNGGGEGLKIRCCKWLVKSGGMALMYAVGKWLVNGGGVTD